MVKAERVTNLHLDSSDRQATHELVAYCVRSGDIRIPNDPKTFRGFVNVVHGADAAYEPGTPAYLNVGKLKYAIIATVLGESGVTEETESSQQASSLAPVKIGTAEHFYRSLLAVFKEDPENIPFTAVNFLAHRVDKEKGFTQVREFIKEKKSDQILAKEADEKRKFKALWQAYAHNRAAGIDKTKFFKAIPPLS